MQDNVDKQQEIIINFLKKMKDENGISPEEIKTEAICSYTWLLNTDFNSLFSLDHFKNFIVITVITKHFVDKNENDLLILFNALNRISYCGNIALYNNNKHNKNILLTNTNFYKSSTYSVDEIAHLIDKVSDWFNIYVVSGSYYFDEKMSEDEAIKKAMSSLKKRTLN